MFMYYKDLFGKLYLKKGNGPLKRLTSFPSENLKEIKLRPPGGVKINHKIFFTEISDEEFFAACKCWSRKSNFG